MPMPVYILTVFQEAHGGQFSDLVLIDGGLEREIKVIQGLLDEEVGHLDILLVGPSLFGFCFSREDMIQNWGSLPSPVSGSYPESPRYSSF